MFPIPPSERLIETKTCRWCSSPFPITDKDLEFYDKVSPIFNGKKCSIPAPTLCPDCRQQRRISWKNERRLYKRECSFSGKPIVSIYHPEKPFPVYDQAIWWGDQWDAAIYAQEWTFEKSFTEQFGALARLVPRLSMVNTTPENSEYCNAATSMKNSYLRFNAMLGTDCAYCKGILRCEDTLDCFRAVDAQSCYGCVDVHQSYRCFWSQSITQCRECRLCFDCVDCEHCFGCAGLMHSKYHCFGVAYTPEAYEQKVAELQAKHTFAELYQHFLLQKQATPHEFAILRQSEDCIGDNIHRSSHAYHCFDVVKAENLKYCYDLREDNADCYDVANFGSDLRRAYEVNSSGHFCSGSGFVDYCWNTVSDLWYCSFCLNNTHHCFGCIGLKNKEYCILNKQYTREEYEELVPRIIEHMRKTGEWGEFMNPSISHFGYNETIAMEYFPLTRDEALKRGFQWSEYESPSPTSTRVIPGNKLPDTIENVPDDVLNWAIACEVTGKLFKITPQELAFYRKHKLPLPRRHPDQRHLDRMKLRNPRKLFERKCDCCEKSMLTTYAPERTERVYCEGCYQKEIVG